MKKQLISLGNLTSVLTAAQPKIDELTEGFKAAHVEATDYDVELFQLAVISDFIAAFGRYIKASDEITVNGIAEERGVIVYKMSVIREGQAHHMNTSVIIAGGYNIQRRHYRYMVDSSLPVMSPNHPAIKAVADAKKRLTLTEKLSEDIRLTIRMHDHREQDFITKMGMSAEQITAGLNYAWEDLNEFGRADFGTKENFEADITRRREERIAEHRAKYNEKALDRMVKAHGREYAKKQVAMDKKLAAL